VDRYPEIRDLQLLLALAQRKHFTRAAVDCGISQPAFSARITHLEKLLGVPIVRRGNKFLGFTKEGDLVLKWARKLVTDVEGMRQDIENARDDLQGVLAVGVVPTALPYAASISTALRARYEHLTIQIQSLSSTQIARALHEFAIDAGVTYEDDKNNGALRFDSIYQEHYVLLSPLHMAPRNKGTATWAEAAQLPLCLLSKDMRFRQIVDEVFQLAGVVARLCRSAMVPRPLSRHRNWWIVYFLIETRSVSNSKRPRLRKPSASRLLTMSRHCRQSMRCAK